MSKTKLESFLSVSDTEEKKILAISQKASTHYNCENHVKLKSLGFVKTKNFDTIVKQSENIKKVGDIIEIQDLVKDINEALGNDIKLISFPNLIKYCKENSLVFGLTKLFTGKLPNNIFEEIVDFNYDRLDNFSIISPREELNTITDYYSEHSTPSMYIATSPHYFEDNKAVISNTEVVSSSIHRKLSNLPVIKRCDNLLLSPVKKLNKIYFIILKVW